MARDFGITNAAPYASAPAVGAVGDMYWNSTEKLLYVSDGAAWVAPPTGGGGSIIIEELNTQETSTPSVAGLQVLGASMLAAGGAIQVGKGYRYVVSGSAARPISSTIAFAIKLGNADIFAPAAIAAATSTARFFLEAIFYVVDSTTVWVNALQRLHASGAAPAGASPAQVMAEGAVSGLNFAFPLQLMCNFGTAAAGNVAERRRAVVSVA